MASVTLLVRPFDYQSDILMVIWIPDLFYSGIQMPFKLRIIWQLDQSGIQIPTVVVIVSFY